MKNDQLDNLKQVEDMLSPRKEIRTPSTKSPGELNPIVTQNRDKRITCTIILYKDGLPEEPTPEQLELERILGERRPCKDIIEVQRVIDTMDYHAMKEGYQSIDPTLLMLGLYGAGVIAGIRQERERRNRERKNDNHDHKPKGRGR